MVAGCAAVSWPLAAHAQQPGERVRVIGFLGRGAAFYCDARHCHSNTCYTSFVILGLGVSPMRRQCRWSDSSAARRFLIVHAICPHSGKAFVKPATSRAKML